VKELKLGDVAVQVQTHSRLLDVLRARKLNILAACGGRGLCATCHVYVKAGADQCSPVSAREERTLLGVTGARKASRLACQVQIGGDGVQVDLPEGMYLQSFTELEALIGKRTRSPILHPRDGRILVPKDKIITRSAIASIGLQDLDLNTFDTE
jgi:ferredoxin